LALARGAPIGYHGATMLRDPRERMLALGAALAVLAHALLAVPAVITGLPFALPILAVAAAVGLILVCHNGVAVAARRRDRGRRG
jgi:hypothetical protein